MKSMLIRLSTILLAIMLVSTFVPACTPAQSAKIGFNPVLSISEPPALGKPVVVTLTFSTPLPKALEGRGPYYHARVELPAGHVYEVIDGALEQTGNMSTGKHTLSATIKSVRETGSGQIYGWVSLILTDKGVQGPGSEFDVLFISITNEGATVSRTMPTQPAGQIPETRVPPGSYTTSNVTTNATPPSTTTNTGNITTPGPAKGGPRAPESPKVGFNP